MLTKKRADRFWSYVQKGGPDDCWEWRGCRKASGHGRFIVEKKVRIASRIAYILTHGPLADGLFVCHTCDSDHSYG